jgi:serine/threonine-protein kinase
MTGDDADFAAGTGTVTPERFARVRAIFEAALEQTARERPAFVKGACVGDAGLRREVEAMLAADATGTPLLDHPASTPSSSAPEEGRFPAGTVLAGRYRILGRLGQGGMGEVYRAHDLILNQTVALKFLAPAHLGDAALARFRNEVRIARQVSHPNVCRVYDLGMAEGLHFLSMESIDGEDLASLLRRIGRLPQDKAIEFTRKICAGLAAAHERGVLHRDLKPANIMIDGRGQPRITDFGLAGLAEEIPLSDLRSGTPAYMSPEQKAGKDVTVRSDLYALGLVLHEMFTGKPRKDTQSSPSELVKDLDPAIERLILRCLAEDPKRRPSSALNVAMALPGADPIAAALAAGETPSPEMVAASQEKEGFSPATAWIWFGAVIVMVALSGFWTPFAELVRRVPLHDPPEVMAFKAQGILTKLGYPEPPKTRYYGFGCCDTGYLRFLEQTNPSGRDPILASGQPPIIDFWYRQHRGVIGPPTTGLAVSYESPPNAQPGMSRLRLDTNGRLVALEVEPDSIGSQAPTSDPDVSALFSAAGLDPARFQTATPQRVPPMSTDARMAWVGGYGDDRSEQLRVEAAFWEGRPVFFTISGSWQSPDADVPLRVIVNQAVVGLATTTALVFAWRNIRAGRGDRRGARRVAFLVLLLSAGALALSVSDWTSGPRKLTEAFGFSCVIAAVYGCLYLGVEPLLRRNWPDALISWTRALGGQVRNPLVASHVLAGLGLQLAGFIAGRVLFVSEPLRAPFRVDSLDSSATSLGLVLLYSTLALGYVILFIMVIVVLRLALRRTWIADLIGSVVFSAVLNTGAVTDAGDLLGIIYFILHALVILWLLRRFGFLAVLVGMIAEFNIVTQPLVYSTWYTSRGLLPVTLIALAATWSLWVIVSDKRHVPSELAF